MEEEKKPEEPEKTKPEEDVTMDKIETALE